MSRPWRSLRKEFRSAFRTILSGKDDDRLKEAALPAYAHVNPVIAGIFWGRLSLVLEQVRKMGVRKVLDFGCGAGILSEALAERGLDVTALDTDFFALDEVRRLVDFSPAIRFVNLDLEKAGLPAESFDAVLTLDVLEHVPDPAECLEMLFRVLRPGGVVVISGPTENFLYRIGRSLAGRQFHGHYHKRGIREVEKAAESIADRVYTASIPLCLTLFRITVFRKR